MTKTILHQKQKYFIFSLKRNFSELFLSITVLSIMLLIISNPALFSGATISGIKLFFYSVLPGLFPFMFLTKLLTEIGFAYKLSNKLNKVSNKIFGTPGISLYAFFMSILSGYPIGAKIISDLYSKNLITKNDAKKMSLFCTTSGPIFVIGAVGVGMLKSFKLGLIIYLSHIISSLLLGISYNLISKNKITTIVSNNHISYKKSNNIIQICLSETINSLFIVCGYITIFYLLSEIFELLNIFNFLTIFISKLFGNTQIETVKNTLYGIVEITHGIKNLSFQTSINAPLICALISFSGFSIIIQSVAFLKTAKIKTHTFVLFKCVHSILSFLICKLFIIFF